MAFVVAGTALFSIGRRTIPTIVVVRLSNPVVRGLAEDSPEGNHRQGELVVEDNTNVKHTFEIVADHQYPIPDNKYTLLGSETFDYSEEQVNEQYWIVGRRLSEQKFEKISVFRLPCFEEVKRLYDLGVATKAEVALA